MASTRRILCLAPNWLGDSVLSLPAVALLQRSGAQVHVLVRKGIGRIYEGVLGPDGVWESSARSRWSRWHDAWRLRSHRYDAALVLPPSFSSALMAWAAGAPLRLGERGDGRAPLLTRPLPSAGREVHLSLRYFQLATALLESLSLPGPISEGARLPFPRLRARPEEQRGASEILQRHGISGRPLLVIAPGARFGPAKRYPTERFARAAARLCREFEFAVALVGSPSDREETAALRSQLPQAVDLAGQTSMPLLLGILAAARGVLSNDSGIMHLAAALGTPVVGVFGSTDPKWTAPLGERARVVQNHVPCSPCFRKTCPIDFPCMQQLEPERLVEAMQALLGRAPAG